MRTQMITVLAAACLLGAVCTGRADATPVVTTEGTQLLYLTSGPDDRGEPSGGDLTGEFGEEGDLSWWSFDFTAPTDGLFELDLNVLTGEVSGLFADPFFVVIRNLIGDTVFAYTAAIGEDNGAFSALAKSFYDPWLVGPDFSFFEDGQTGFFTLSQALVAGAYSLEIAVMDEEDLIIDTALLVDNIRFDSVLLEGFEFDSPYDSPLSGVVLSGLVQVVGNGDFEQLTLPVPEPSTVTLLGLGLLATGLYGRRLGMKRVS